jgi:Sulfotransferase family
MYSHQRRKGLDPLCRPNLFIIGAMKCGTSSLHHYLNAHSAIFMCDPKEPCYFVDPRQFDWAEVKKLDLWKDESRYLKLFAGAKNAAVIGESSTWYTKYPLATGVPERIARFNPAARLIYIMRDPVERTISHYLHAVRRDYEYRNMVTAIKENRHYRDVSYYSMQLRQYANFFPREQILTLIFEDMAANPIGVITRVLDWLGVDSSIEIPNLQEKINVGPEQFEIVRGKGQLQRFRYSPFWERIGRIVPKFMRRFGTRLAVRQASRSALMDSSEETIEFLRPIQRAQTEELKQELGRDLQEWKTLYPPEVRI